MGQWGMMTDECVYACARQAINGMLEADFLRVAQSADLDSAMGAALSSLQAAGRCGACGLLHA
jgi:hypothetical protein